MSEPHYINGRAVPRYVCIGVEFDERSRITGTTLLRVNAPIGIEVWHRPWLGPSGTLEWWLTRGEI